VATLALVFSLLAGCDTRCRVDLDCPRSQRCSSGQCSPLGGGETDGGLEADARPDARADADLADADVGDGPGIRALVLTSIEMNAEPMCDLDGDGVDDNALATVEPLVVTMMTAGLVTGLLNSHSGVLLDAHSIPDLAAFEGPFDGALVAGRDCIRSPVDTDIAGELFDARRGYYDEATLMPLFPVSMSLTEGLLEGRFEVVSVPLLGYGAVWPWRAGRFRGVVSAGGRGIEAGILCFHCRAAELAAIAVDPAGERNVLDMFVAPGSTIGLPGTAGIQPDIDLDGDGLESFVADAEERISVCIDGDGTVIESSPDRPCALAPGIEDAISLTIRFEAGWSRLLRPGRDGDDCPLPGADG
jgi:hypothetical protein